MILGFTGTQHKLTGIQWMRLDSYLWTRRSRLDEVHHGDCVGADTMFHQICNKIKDLDGTPTIVIHPPSNPSKRAYNIGDICLPPQEYLDRNHDIVDASQHLVACPQHDQEVLRSGTWATIRYAVKTHVSVTILWPDGTAEAR